MTEDHREIANLTKDEIIARIQADPGFQADQAERAARQNDFHAYLTRSEAPIVLDLQAAGLLVNSVWHNQTTPENAQLVTDIYLRHLEKGGYPDRVRAGMAHVLATTHASKAASKYWTRIKALYAAERDPETIDALTSTLASIASRQTVGELIDLTLDPARRASALLFLKSILRLGGEGGLGFI